MWVLVAVAIGGELLGVAGMFLMIPVTSVIYTLLREATNNRLSNMDIDSNKLKAHPPQLQSKFKKKPAKTAKKEVKGDENSENV